MSRKVFTAGEVLAAADVNSFLMDQTVMSFAGTAARGSAIPTPVEGMTSFLEDSNILSIYDGANWKTSLNATGSVLQVVSSTTTTQAQTSSTSFVTTGFELAITPKSTSSKVLIIYSGDGYSSTAGVSLFVSIFRGGAGGTNLGNALGFGSLYATSSDTLGYISVSHLDSPNTTSSTTYTLMHRTAGGAGRGIQNRGSMTLMEIAN